MIEPSELGEMLQAHFPGCISPISHTVPAGHHTWLINDTVRVHLWMRNSPLALSLSGDIQVWVVGRPTTVFRTKYPLEALMWAHGLLEGVR